MPETQPTAAEQLAAIDQERAERKIHAWNANNQRKLHKKIRNEHEARIAELDAARPVFAERVRVEAEKAKTPDVKADPAVAAKTVGAKRGRSAKEPPITGEPKPTAETDDHSVNAR